MALLPLASCFLREKELSRVMSQGEQTMQVLPVLRVTKKVSEISPRSDVGLVMGGVQRVVVWYATGSGGGD